MKKFVILLFSTLLILNINGQELKNLRDSASYSIGLNLGKQFSQQGLNEIDVTLLSNAINDILKSAPTKIDFNQASNIIQSYIEQQKEEKFRVNKDKSVVFLAENAKKKGVTTLPSGLQYEILVKGTGEIPTSSDNVEVHYHGTLIDGTVFDSSVERGTPASFPVTGVIKGWVEALQLMPVGSKWKLFIPADLAYGANPRPGGIAVRLISINKL